MHWKADSLMSEPSRKPFVGQRLLHNGRDNREKQLTTGSWIVQSPKVLFLSTPELSNADQEMEAEGVHGIVAVRYTTWGLTFDNVVTIIWLKILSTGLLYQ